MKMKPQYRKGGYSSQIAEQYVSLQDPIYLLCDELEAQQKYEDGKPTGEVSHTKLGLDKRDYHHSKLNSLKSLTFLTIFHLSLLRIYKRVKLTTMSISGLMDLKR